MDIDKIKSINLKTSKKSGPKGSNFHKCYGTKCPHCAEPLKPLAAYPVEIELESGKKLDGGTIVKYAHPRPRHDDSDEMTVTA